MIGGDHPVLRGELAELTPAERVVLLVLWAHADERGVCWPAIKRLSKASGYSYERVRWALRQLRGRGLVTTIGRADPAEPQHSPNRLRLHLPDRAHTTGLGESDRAPTPGPDRAATTARPGAGAHKKNKEEPTGRTRGASRPTARPPSPLRQRAQAVLDPWWARQEVKPATPYMAALKACERALQGGMPDIELAVALDELPAISGGALDFWRNRRGNGRGGAGEEMTPEQLHAANELRQRAEATRARLAEEKRS